MKGTPRFSCLFFTVSICVFVVSSGFAGLAVADSVTVFLLEMPEEYIEYTVCRVNGSLWAKIDGTYPLSKVGVEIQNQSDETVITWFTFNNDTILMLYPTPPGTTNISVKVDETELEWNNYTQTVPSATHYTAIGNWPMIACTIHPVQDQFVLKIHYEHPIPQNNGSYTFLYDLNVSPYLSPWSNKSTAHFNIKFETEITDLQAHTIATDNTTNPVNYTTTKQETTQTMSLKVVSEYAQPLFGDLLISFSENKETKGVTSGFFGSNLPVEQGYVIVTATTFVLVGLTGYLFMKRKNRSKKE